MCWYLLLKCVALTGFKGICEQNYSVYFLKENIFNTLIAYAGDGAGAVGGGGIIVKQQARNVL